MISSKKSRFTIPLIFAGLFIACISLASTNANIYSIRTDAERIAGTHLPPTAKNLSAYKKLHRKMTVAQVFRAVGCPYGNVGGDFDEYVYRLKNDVGVIVASHDEVHVMYVCYYTNYDAPHAKKHIVFYNKKWADNWHQ